MGQQLPRLVHEDFMGEGMGEFVGRVSMVLANWAGLWLWGLAVWLFLVSVGAHYSCATRGKLDFAMTWYSFVFPNTALTTSTFAISYALHGDLTEAPGFSRGARPFQILGWYVLSWSKPRSPILFQTS
jgi:tellurite resistance protein TehA-like permease